MTERKPQFVPVCYVGKEDLLSCRPDLAGGISDLDEDDIASIADNLGDALQETYWLALEIVLTHYLGIDNTQNEPGEESH